MIISNLGSGTMFEDFCNNAWTPSEDVGTSIKDSIFSSRYSAEAPINN